MSSRIDSTPRGSLQGALHASQFFTIGLGAIIGVAWAIMLGNWLITAAPFGAMLGFLFGATFMLPVAACYAELATLIPSAGGEVSYTLAAFGRPVAFIVGWFIVLMAISMASFEAISLAWFVELLFPAVTSANAYRLLGSDVHYSALCIGAALMVVISVVNYRGAGMVGRFQDTFTYLKAGAVVIFVISALVVGHAENLRPLWTPISHRSPLLGIVWIAATAPVWYGGFQIVPQAVEERVAGISLRSIGRLTVLPVFLGLIFYWLVIASSCLVIPWRNLAAAPLPAAVAIQQALHNPVLAKAVLCCIVMGILATWNACFLWAARLLLALGRAGMIPAPFGWSNRYQSPGVAVLFVGIAGLLGVFLGRGAIVPIINMASISLAFSYALCCWAALRLRRLRPDTPRPFRTPLGIHAMRFAIASAVIMALVAFFEPLTRTHGLPTEWLLLIVWSTLGILFGLMSLRKMDHSPVNELQQRAGPTE